MENNSYIVRNFQLMKNIFDNLDMLTINYKLSKKEVSIVQELCIKHNSFKFYIECNVDDFNISRKSFYRIIDKLENKNILKIVSRPKNQYSILKVYFTVKFIQIVCDSDFADLYEKWLYQRKECTNN